MPQDKAQDQGASLRDGAVVNGAGQAVSALRASVPSAGDTCEFGCDGYGPFGSCSTCTGALERDDGTLADGDGNDLSDLQIYWLARRLALSDAARVAWLTEPLPEFPVSSDEKPVFKYGKDCAFANIRELQYRDAQAIEAATAAETGTGSVHDSPVAEGHAPEHLPHGDHHG